MISDIKQERAFDRQAKIKTTPIQSLRVSFQDAKIRKSMLKNYESSKAIKAKKLARAKSIGLSR